jgi:hypothetical protein
LREAAVWSAFAGIEVAFGIGGLAFGKHPQGRILRLLCQERIFLFIVSSFVAPDRRAERAVIRHPLGAVDAQQIHFLGAALIAVCQPIVAYNAQTQLDAEARPDGLG